MVYCLNRSRRRALRVARIRTEHRVEAATLKAVIHRGLAGRGFLRNTELRNSIATVNENRAKLALESMQTTGAFEVQTSASGKASKKKFPKKLAAALKAAAAPEAAAAPNCCSGCLAQDQQAKKTAKKKAKEVRDDHCQADCGIPRLVPKSQQSLIGLCPTALFLRQRCTV